MTFDALDWSPLRLSFEVAITATVVSLVVGLPLAWLLARRRFPGRALVEALTTLPLVFPPTVLGYYLLVVLGRRSAIGHAWEAVFGAPLVFTLYAAVIASVIHALPLLVRTARAAIEAVDPALERAARTLGADEVRIAATITLPLARNGIVAACSLAFARALGEFGVTLMVAGNIPGVTRTAAIAIYDAFEAGHDSEAQAMAVVLSAIALATLVVVGKLTERAHDG